MRREPLYVIEPNPAGWNAEDDIRPPWRRPSCWVCLAILLGSVAIVVAGLAFLLREFFGG